MIDVSWYLIGGSECTPYGVVEQVQSTRVDNRKRLLRSVEEGTWEMYVCPEGHKFLKNLFPPLTFELGSV